MSMQLFSRTCCACLHLQGLCLQAFTAKRLKIWIPLRLEKHYRKQKFRNNIQSRDSASSRTCCRMQFRAATKQTDANLSSSHQKGSVKCETGKWEEVVTNDSI